MKHAVLPVQGVGISDEGQKLVIDFVARQMIERGASNHAEQSRENGERYAKYRKAGCNRSGSQDGWCSNTGKCRCNCGF